MCKCYVSNLSAELLGEDFALFATHFFIRSLDQAIVLKFLNLAILLILVLKSSSLVSYFLMHDLSMWPIILLQICFLKFKTS